MAPEDVEAIVAAYRTGADPDDEGGVAVGLVPLAEIKGNGFDLNIGRYLRRAAEEVVDVQTALAELREAQAALHEAEAEMWKRLEAAGYA
jgi:type I restriction enzyme M protein